MDICYKSFLLPHKLFYLDMFDMFGFEVLSTYNKHDYLRVLSQLF